MTTFGIVAVAFAFGSAFGAWAVRLALENRIERVCKERDWWRVQAHSKIEDMGFVADAKEEPRTVGFVTDANGLVRPDDGTNQGKPIMLDWRH